MDPNEEMEPFHMERFLDRLVENDLPAKAGYICDAPVAADTPSEVATKGGNSHPSNSSSAAKLFLQPIDSSPGLSKDLRLPRKEPNGGGPMTSRAWCRTILSGTLCFFPLGSRHLMLYQQLSPDL